MSTEIATNSQPGSVTTAGFFEQGSFELMQRVAKAFASSDLVPAQYKGADKIANCMIAMDMAQRIGANPLMVMQNLYIVHGTPGWSSKFMVATINASGRYSSLRYEWKGEPGSPEYGCRAWAIERATNERLNGIWVTWQMVNAEGWASKNGSKWKTMPDQMFVYRAAAFWQRAYAPELGMGLTTAEDIEDTFDATRDNNGSYSVVSESVQQQTPASRTDAVKEILRSKQKVVDVSDFIEQSDAFGFDAVKRDLQNAKDIDALNVAADLINEIADEAQQMKLKEIFEARKELLESSSE